MTHAGLGRIAIVLCGAFVVGCGASGGGDDTSGGDAGSDAPKDTAVTPFDSGKPDSSPSDSKTDTSVPPDTTPPPPDTAPPPDTTPPGPDTTEPPPLDLHDCTLYDNPTGVADWAVTTTLTVVDFGDGVHVEFDKQDGASRWPDITPPGWGGPLQYTLGFCEYIGGKWVGSAAMQYWYGLDRQGGNVAQDTVSLAQCTAFGYGSSCQVAKNWYYDSRWGELAGYQPMTGEWIAVFVVAGNLRGVHDDGSQSPVHERSNVVLVQMPDMAGKHYTF